VRSVPQKIEAIRSKYTKFSNNEKAIGGIPAGIINIVTVMIILTMVPMIIIPMETASQTSITAYDDDSNVSSSADAWNTSYNNVIDNNRNAFGTLSGITSIQATILILAVVLAIAM